MKKHRCPLGIRPNGLPTWARRLAGVNNLFPLLKQKRGSLFVPSHSLITILTELSQRFLLCYKYWDRFAINFWNNYLQRYNGALSWSIHLSYSSECHLPTCQPLTDIFITITFNCIWTACQVQGPSFICLGWNRMFHKEYSGKLLQLRKNSTEMETFSCNLLLLACISVDTSHLQKAAVRKNSAECVQRNLRYDLTPIVYWEEKLVKK